MDCRTAQTAPGLTLTGWRSNRPPAFFCFGGSGVERRKTCPLRGDSAAFALPATPRQRNTPRLRLPLLAPSGAFFRRRSAALFGLAAFPRPFPLRGRPVQSLRSTHGGQKLPSEPKAKLARCARQRGARVRLCRFPCPGRVVALFRSFCICRSPCPSPSTDRCSAGGPDERCPLKTTPAGRPGWRSLAGEGRRTRRTAEHQKKDRENQHDNKDREKGSRAIRTGEHPNQMESFHR